MVRSLDRTASSTGSEKVGMLEPGTRVKVLEESMTGDGVRRVRIAEGWCSTTSANGKVFLRPVTATATATGAEATDLKPEPEHKPWAIASSASSAELRSTRRSTRGLIGFETAVKVTKRFQKSGPQLLSTEDIMYTSPRLDSPRRSIKRHSSRAGAPEPQQTASGGVDLPAAARGLKKLDGCHHAPITCCSFGPKRELCTASWDKTATISAADTGQHLHTLPTLHTDGMTLARSTAAPASRLACHAFAFVSWHCIDCLCCGVYRHPVLCIRRQQRRIPLSWLRRQVNINIQTSQRLR